MALGVGMVGPQARSQMELPAGTPTWEVALTAYEKWLRNFALGDPGGLPWLSIGLLVGAGCGALGYLWSKRHSRLAGLAVAGTLVVEPLVYLTSRRDAALPGAGVCVVAAEPDHLGDRGRGWDRGRGVGRKLGASYPTGA